MAIIKNFRENNDVYVREECASMAIYEYLRDLSVTPSQAVQSYYMQQMNVRKRQLVCDLSKSAITTQAGSMQWMLGDVTATTGIKSAGDLIGKALKSKVTSESAIKPEYKGTGTLVLEPTYLHLLLEDLSSWNGNMVLDDGLFLASEASVKHTINARSNLSSAVFGGEGLFNLSLQGSGVVCIESPVPREELITINLTEKDDVLKIDGNLAIAWSGTLKFTTERTTKSLIGSAASGEGLVNVYRGIGKVLMAPVR